jgi:hypothetical protein
MIKRYNQFVKERIDENIDEEEDLGFATHDGSFDGDDSDFDEMDDEISNSRELPIEVEEDNFGEEEEEGGDIYSAKMNQLAQVLGTEVTDKNTIEYDNKQIIFPSETEMFHVDNKKFKTVEEVANYLEGGSVEGGSIHRPQLPKNEIPQEEMELQESKSYRAKRLKK